MSCLTLCDSMNYSLSGSSVHGIITARILKWVAVSCSRGSFPSRDWTHVFCGSCIGRWILYHWTTREAQEYWGGLPIPSPGEFPKPGIKPGSPALQADSLPAESPGKPWHSYSTRQKMIKIKQVQYGVITNLEPDIMERQVKWAIGNITANKASGGDGSSWAISNPKRWC